MFGLKWLTGSKGDKALDIFDKRSGEIFKGIDNAFHTSEEKAEMELKRANVHLKLVEVTANASTVQAITRRVIAVSFVVSFLFWVHAAGVYILMGSIPKANTIIDLCKIMAPYVGGVAIFYFGPSGIAAGVNAVKNIKGK